MSMGQNTDVLVERIVAEVVDLVVTFGVTLGLVLAALLAVGGLGAAAGGQAVRTVGLVGVLLVVVVTLIISIGYNVVLEVVWDGQTVGKRLLGIKVVETDGSAPGVVPVVIRNLPAVFAAVVGAILVYPLILPVGLAAILLSEENQRVFDVFAGTLVVAA